MTVAGRSYRPLLGIALMLTFTSLAAGLDAITKLLTATYPVPQLLWIRFLGQTLSLLVLIPWLGWRGLVATSAPMTQVGRGLLLGLSAGSFVFALSYLPFATAKVLSFTSPLLVALLSLPLLGERVGWRRGIAVAVGFAGVVIVIRPGVGMLEWAMGLPLLTATAYALYQLLTRRVALHDAAVASLFYVSLVGFLMASLVAPFHWVAIEPGLLALLLVHGAIAGLGHFLQIMALSMASPALLAPFGYASLIWAVLIGYGVFGEPADLGTIIGGVTIAACGIYLFRSATTAR